MVTCKLTKDVNVGIFGLGHCWQPRSVTIGNDITCFGYERLILNALEKRMWRGMTGVHAQKGVFFTSSLTFSLFYLDRPAAFLYYMEEFGICITQLTDRKELSNASLPHGFLITISFSLFTLRSILSCLSLSS